SRLSVQCWTQVTVSVRKAPPAFLGGAAATVASVMREEAFLRSAASDVAADVVGRQARRAGDVNAAFGLILTLPAAGANVLPFLHRVRARPAADRRKPLRDQRMGRQLVQRHIGV